MRLAPLYAVCNCGLRGYAGSPYRARSAPGKPGKPGKPGNLTCFLKIQGKFRGNNLSWENQGNFREKVFIVTSFPLWVLGDIIWTLFLCYEEMYCQIMVAIMKSSCYWHFMIMFSIPDCCSCLKIIFSNKVAISKLVFKIALLGY